MESLRRAAQEDSCGPTSSRPRSCLKSEANATPGWRNNAQRNGWRLLKRHCVGWKVPVSEFHYTTADGEVLTIPYLDPKTLLESIIKDFPDLLFGEVVSGPDCSSRLECFWAAYKQSHPAHTVYDPEIGCPLAYAVPLALHGDEGRGKRRTGTLCVSLESPLGIKVPSPKGKKRKHYECRCCDPCAQHANQFNQRVKQLPEKVRATVAGMRTNTKGNCFLQRWPLFVIPGVVYKAHPELVMEIHDFIGKKIKALWHEGFSGPNGRTYFGALLGLKGDMKWHTWIGRLTRSYEHKGTKQHLPCCSECLGGTAAVPWEDCSARPIWEPTMFTTRPWDPPPAPPPPLLQIPFDQQEPERFYRKDPFHIGKLGALRELVGSILFWCVENKYFGAAGQLPDKLVAAHAVFKLYCLTEGQQPSLRSFSKALFMYKSRQSFPWANTKGSDTVLLVAWLLVQLSAFRADPLKAEDVAVLDLMHRTATAGMEYYDHLYAHGLFLRRKCAIKLYLEGSRYINGYNLLAHQFLGRQNIFGIKPKLHMWKHTLVEMRQLLESGAEWVLNPLCFNNEGNEDAIGRLSRLSRRLDSRNVGEKVLMCFLVKAHLAYKNLHPKR